MCLHVADYTTQRRRNHWANALVEACKEADHPNHCVAEGSKGIMELGNRKHEKLLRNCLWWVGKHQKNDVDDARQPSLLAQAIAVFGCGWAKAGLVGHNSHGLDTHMLTHELNK